MATSNFASLVRLYRATFNRSFDKEGLGFWASNLARGSITFSEVADQFLKSAEFETQYGTNVSNESFVVILHKNTSKTELNETKTKTLVDSLTESTSNSQFLLQLSESTEHVTSVESEYSFELEEAKQVEQIQLDIISQETTTTTTEVTTIETTTMEVATTETINLEVTDPEDGSYTHTHTYEHTHKGEKEHDHDHHQHDHKDEHDKHDEHDHEKGKDKDKDKHEGHDHEKDKDKDKHDGHDHEKDKDKDKDKHDGHDHKKDKDKDKDKHEGHDHEKDKGYDEHNHKGDRKQAQDYFFEEGTDVPDAQISTEQSLEVVMSGVTSFTEIA